MKAIVITLGVMWIALSSILLMHMVESHTLELQCTDTKGVPLIDKQGRMICIDRGSIIELFENSDLK